MIRRSSSFSTGADRPSVPGSARPGVACSCTTATSPTASSRSRPPPRGQARRGLQPRRPEPRQGQLRDARVHCRHGRAGHAPPPRGDPHRGLAVRFYQAGSSEMFGRSLEPPQRETTPFHPRSPYAIAKLFAHWLTINYREAYGLFAANGILFNHESPRRGDTFVTRKVTRGVAAILAARDSTLPRQPRREARLGICAGVRRGDVADAPAGRPDDYVIATGETHTVRELVEHAFSHVGLDWHQRGSTSATSARPRSTPSSATPRRRAGPRLAARPSCSRDSSGIMLEADLRRGGAGSFSPYARGGPNAVRGSGHRVI